MTCLFPATRWLIPILNFCIILLMLVNAACKHEPEPLPAPNKPSGANIPADGICFQENILPILQSNCAISGCHDAVTAEEDLVLTNYNNLMSGGIVSPSDPNNSTLYEVITASPSSEDHMPPPPYSSLSPEQIALIYYWIEQGALDNPCPNACDSNIFTFSGAISPTVQSQCQGCHSGGTPSAGLLLNSYAAIADAVSNRGLAGRINSITNPMPPYGLMSDCKRKQFDHWISGGMPNN
jgi:hypothetical protein